MSRRGLPLKLGLLAGGIAAGAVVATAIGANAATSGTGTGTASPAAPARAGSSAPGRPAGHDGPPGRPSNPGGKAPIRPDEKALGAALTARLKAAALKAVPGGAVYRVESDAGDGTYEAHMTKPDGTVVTVKFDKNGAVTGVEPGMGNGDPAPGH